MFQLVLRHVFVSELVFELLGVVFHVFFPASSRISFTYVWLYTHLPTPKAYLYKMREECRLTQDPIDFVHRFR